MNIVIDGKKIKVLFTFNIDEKEYVAYLNEDDSISASIMKRIDDQVELISITDEAEWDKVEAAINERI